MGHVRLPGFVYNLLPYLYAGCGILTIALANHGIAIFSGILLVTAGVLVYVVRLQNRRPAEPVVSDRRSAGKGSKDGFLRISWRPSFASGHPVIDAQHKALFAMGNDLVNRIVTNPPKDEYHRQFNIILHHIAEHFKSEESILAECGHPMTASHGEIHRSLLAKAEAISRQFKTQELPAREVISFIVFDLVTDHLMKEDVYFFDGIATERGHFPKTK